MKEEKLIVVFEDQPVRRVWDEKAEKWFFSVVDIVRVLTDSVNPRDYWFKMKIRVKSEDGILLSTICRQPKLMASDGKKYLRRAGYFENRYSLPLPREGT